jgi:predicted dienelactone hydrolase
LKIKLPQPTGAFAIGVTDFELVDDSRADLHEPRSPRRIPIRAWYPAAAETGQLRPYASPTEFEHQLKVGLSLIFPNDDRMAASFDVPTHAYQDAPVARTSSPVLIYSHGYMGYLGDNTALCEELASQGAVILSIGHPYLAIATIHDNGDVTSFDGQLWETVLGLSSDDRYLEALVLADPAARLERLLTNLRESPLRLHAAEWERDFSFVIDCLYNEALPTALNVIADRDRLAIIGMSFGATGCALALKDGRVRAAVDLDGGCFDESMIDVESRCPVLVIHSDLSLALPERRVYPVTEFCFEPLDQAGLTERVVRLEIRGAAHLAFTDFCLTPDAIRKTNPGVNARLGPIGGARMIEIVGTLVGAFLGETLGGKAPSEAARMADRFPEVSKIDLTQVREWRRSLRNLEP